MKNQTSPQNLDLTESPSGIVQKSNSLIQLNRFIGESKGQSLSLLEHKIFAYAISLLDQDQPTLKPVTFSIHEFWKECDIIPDTTKYFTLIEKALEKLHGRRGWITLVNPDGSKKKALVGLIEMPEYSEDKRTCTVNFNPNLAPALLMLKGHYTRYPRSCIMRLESKYGFALFELLCSYEYLHSPLTFSFPDLAERLDATNYNSRPSNFKAKVIEAAVKDINAHSSAIHVDFELAKTGHKLTHVTFQTQRLIGGCASIEGNAIPEEEQAEQAQLNAVKKQIDYDALLFDIQAGKLPYKEETLQLILEVMSSTLSSPQQTFKINDCQMPAYKVQAEFEKLNMFHIQHILDKLENAAKDIKNPRAYIRSMLFNAPATIDVLVQSQINSDNAKIYAEPHPQQPVPDQWDLDEIQRYLSAPI